jgi:hypothetical protein
VSGSADQVRFRDVITQGGGTTAPPPERADGSVARDGLDPVGCLDARNQNEIVGTIGLED